ncbi:c-type cytochrome [Rhizobium sp. CRIBSB]|nr:c-type cytochrome [Rhizobium sp. CRIBSB]
MNMRSIALALLLGSCSVLPPAPSTNMSPAGFPARTEPATAMGAAALLAASIARGAAFVQAECAGCHAVGPDGSSPAPGAPPLRQIGRRYPVEQLSEAFAEGLVTTHAGMPEFRLAEEENRDLIAYLASIQTPQ